MDITHLSRDYYVRCLAENDVPAVLTLCAGNPLYYEYCPPAASAESIRADMTALPPGKGADDKYYIGFFDNDALLAVLDLIAGYPDEKTAYIGFFMTDANVHRQGIGSKIVRELCAGLARQRFEKVKLCWMAGNSQAEGFWHKNGFLETGDTHERDGHKVISACRTLAPRASGG